MHGAFSRRALIDRLIYAAGRMWNGAQLLRVRASITCFIRRERWEVGGGWGGGEVGGGEAIAIARPLRKQAICLHNVPPPYIIFISLFYTLFMYRGRGVQIGLGC